MIKPLQVATDGYLNCAAKTLSIAVAGYLCFSVSQPHNPIYPKREKTERFVRGGGGSQPVNESSFKIRRIQEDDEEIILIIQSFLHTQ